MQMYVKIGGGFVALYEGDSPGLRLSTFHAGLFGQGRDGAALIGQRLWFTDDQRRRLAAKAKDFGSRFFDEIETQVTPAPVWMAS